MVNVVNGQAKQVNGPSQWTGTRQVNGQALMVNGLVNGQALSQWTGTEVN